MTLFHIGIKFGGNWNIERSFFWEKNFLFYFANQGLRSCQIKTLRSWTTFHKVMKTICGDDLRYSQVSLFMSCSILHYVLLPWLICLRYFLSMQYHQWSALPRKARANSLKHQLMSQRKTIYDLVIIRQKHSLSENKWGMLKEKQYKDRNRMPAPRENSSTWKYFMWKMITRTLNGILLEDLVSQFALTSPPWLLAAMEFSLWSDLLCCKHNFHIRQSIKSISVLSWRNALVLCFLHVWPY